MSRIRFKSGPKTARSTPVAPGDRAVLAPADFTYLGVVKVPTALPAHGTAEWDFARGGMACRYVGGNLHLFLTGRNVTGSNIGKVHELIYDATPNLNVAIAPRLSWYRNWGDCFEGGQAIYDTNGVLQRGLLWDGEKLLYTFGAFYVNEYSRSLGAITFNGTASSTAYGPWRPNCNPKQVNSCPALIPEVHRPAFGGRNVFGAGWNSSINSPNTFGLGFEAYSTSGLLSAPADAQADENQQTILTQRIMFAGVNNRMNRAATWQGCLRGAAETGYSCITGPTTLYDPEPIWSDLDCVAGACWIHNTTKHGVVYIANLIDRVNDAQFRTDNYNGGNLPHYWYSISGVPCCHGHVSQGEGTGPHSPSIVPQMWIYDPATILASAAGTITPLQAINTPATSHKHLNDYSPNFAQITTEYRQSSTYDPVSRLLFVAWADQDPVAPPYAYYPHIHVFQVAD